FNCHFLPDRILILGSRSVFVFWKKSGKFQLGSLPLPATGPCAVHRENIFYGSGQRQLVKVSLPGTRLAWKIRLGHDLKRQPLVLAGTLLVCPEDNSVLQFNRRGSVRWWLGLDSILQYDLVPLANQLAAFLLNNEIKFIDVRRRATTVFRISGRPAGPPLAFKNELYFLTAAGKTQKLQRVGNRYGIEVERTPKQALLPWAPITFSMQTSNLLRPRLRCEIRDEAGQVLLVKKFSPSERARLVWLPEQAGAYRLHVSAAALNRTEETELAFLVFDPRRIILYLLGCF
ncbi:MAG TPA: hypothetical protein VLQ89_03410, partial [Candidatus Binatia bacterium]|nr:hypothetical protein [Candidatus Binatia bacterium]